MPKTNIWSRFKARWLNHSSPFLKGILRWDSIWLRKSDPNNVLKYWALGFSCATVSRVYREFYKKKHPVSIGSVGINASILMSSVEIQAKSHDLEILKGFYSYFIPSDFTFFITVLFLFTQEASRRFSMPAGGLESQLKQENFILGSST